MNEQRRVSFLVRVISVELKLVVVVLADYLFIEATTTAKAQFFFSCRWFDGESTGRNRNAGY